MPQTSSPHPLALQALCDQAGAQAAGGAPAFQRPETTAAWGPKTLAALAFGLVGLGVLAAHWLAAPDEAPAAMAATPPRALPALPTLMPETAAGPAHAVAAEGLASVHWQGPLLVMQLQQLPLAQAVAQLAVATRSTVAGADQLRQPVAMTIDWRGRDIAAAWHYLLQGRAGFSVSCGGNGGNEGGSACHVWITSERSVPGATAGLGGPDVRPHQTPAGHEPAEIESQPDGSC